MAVTNFDEKIKAWLFPITMGMLGVFGMAVFAKLDKIDNNVQTMTTKIEVMQKAAEYSKSFADDHEQRLRALERSQIKTDNTRVNYETYNR